MDAFLGRLTAAGTLSYSSYFGGSGDDMGRALALGPRGNAYAGGWTNFSNLPTTTRAC